MTSEAKQAVNSQQLYDMEILVVPRFILRNSNRV